MVASLILLSAALLAPEARGATRYVSTKGADGSNLCTVAAVPCRTIVHAVAVALAGDTISVGQGKFVEPFGVTIDKNLTFTGAGIFGTRVGYTWTGFSVFRVTPLATVTIADLQVTFGDAGTGGGGGIDNSGHLTLDGVWVWRNRAAFGGGILNRSEATLLVSRSEIARNTGGGLDNGGHVELTEVRIVVNYASTSASFGIANRGSGSLNVRQSQVSHNDGVGISNFASTLFVSDTTVARNGLLGISTVNEAFSQLVHVTVVENGKGSNANVIRGGLHIGETGEVELVSTIVANNTPVQCFFHDPGDSLAEARFSLISDGSCRVFPSADMLLNVDPQLGPLKYNGGRSHTYALKPSSPAIDAGSPLDCHPWDQRGVSRLADGDGDGEVNCDIGAYEYAPLPETEP